MTTLPNLRQAHKIVYILDVYAIVQIRMCRNGSAIQQQCASWEFGVKLSVTPTCRIIPRPSVPHFVFNRYRLGYGLR